MSAPQTKEPKMRPLPVERDYRAADACTVLEQRILMSASPFDSHLDGMETVESQELHLHAPLNGNESAITLTPLFVGEDHNNTYLDLSDAFETGEAPVEFELISITESGLFTSVDIVDGQLVFEYAPDQHGISELAISATIDSEVVVGSMVVNVLPVNDRPTTTGFSEVFVSSGTDTTVIDLFNAFDDIEDQDYQLTYSVTEISNSDLFESVVIDNQLGTLTLNYRPNTAGSSTLTVRATDLDGLYVEMSTAGTDFTIYDDLQGTEGIHRPASLNLPSLQRLTSFAFFDDVDGEYDYSQLDAEEFANVLNNYVTADGGPVVLNIEHDLFDNSPEGRDRLAEVLSILEQERPDLQRYGFYRLLPDRNWGAAVNWYRAVEDQQLDVRTGYSRPDRYAQYEQEYNDWLARNERYRSEELGPEFEGSLADHITQVNPSLYTFYRTGFRSTTAALMFSSEVDTQANSLRVDEAILADGMSVYLRAGNNSTLPSGLRQLTNYYVVNYDEHSFQLSDSIGGPPIEINSAGTGSIFVNVENEYLELDPSVRYWRAYAEANIEEAEKFGVDVNAYISPSFKGIGLDYLDKNFFRMQLDTLYELEVDSITLFNLQTPEAAGEENQGWWAALQEFHDYVNSPTQFTVTIGSEEHTEIPTLIVPVLQSHESFSLANYLSLGTSNITYSLGDVSNPSVFVGIDLDAQSGLLSLEFSNDHWGTSQIAVVANGDNGFSADATVEVIYARLFAPLNQYEAGDAAQNAARNQSLFAAAVAYHDVTQHDRLGSWHRTNTDFTKDRSIDEPTLLLSATHPYEQGFVTVR